MHQIFYITLFLLTFSSNSYSVERPPQYVNLAFDGSKSTRMWKNTTDFANAENIKFTYFISGVYFISDANKRFYKGPRRNAGSSDIGFGGSPAHVKARANWVNFAYSKGHEIAAHANGHFDGSRWSINEWASELQQFMNVLSIAPQNYGGPRLNAWNRILNNIIGFRAPLLGKNQSMYSALAQSDYAYDTSRVRPANHWPQVVSGVWNFPLASLRMAYSGKRTLSMDYNMYVAHSDGKKGSAANYDRWENEVYLTYLKYFKANYIGNRAPLDIGHHFSQWNGGIYWRAMQRFARTVCGIPEVICGTYTDLLDFLNKKGAGTIQQYQAGKFPRASATNLPASIQQITDINWADEALTPEIIKQLESQVCPSEAHMDDGHEEHIISDGVYL